MTGDVLPGATRGFLRGAVATLVVLNVLNAYAIARRPWERPGDRWLLIDIEGNPWTWYAASLLLTVALAALVCGEAASDADRVAWRVVAGLAALMSLDEAASLHERFEASAKARFGTDGPLHYPWFFPAGVVLVVLAILSVSFLRRLPRDTARGLVLAAALFLMGAGVLEVVTAEWVARNGDANFGHLVLTTIEENVEVIGLLVALAVMAGHLRATGAELVLRRSGAADDRQDLADRAAHDHIGG